MTFLNPTYLWAFLGVLVPIAIHLWSRKKVVTIKVGSTKLLTESEPKQTSAVRPNELWLLALRMLTIALLALILSGVRFKKNVQKTRLTYLIAPALISSDKMENLLDSLPSEATRVLAPHFPEVEDYDPETEDRSVPDYWQLAREMESLVTDSIIVFTNGYVKGLKGMRPSIASNVNWIVIDSEEESNTVVRAGLKKGAVQLLSVSSNAKSLGFTKEIVSLNNPDIKLNSSKDSLLLNGNSLQLNPEKTFKIGVVYDDSLSQEMKYISAAYRAVSKYIDVPIAVVATTHTDSLGQDTFDTTVWLGKEPIQNQAINQILFRRDALANDLITPSDSKNEFYLTSRLNSENIVSEHLAEKLLTLLNSHEGLSRKIKRLDKRVSDVKELRTVPSPKSSKQRYAKLLDVSPWLWILLFVVLVFERILAKYRKQ